MLNKITLAGSIAIPLLIAGALAIGPFGTASADDRTNVELRAAETHTELAPAASDLRDDYDRAYGEAKELGVAPKQNAAKTTVVPAVLDRRLSQLRSKLEKAREAKKAREEGPKAGRPESVGVSTATLEAIAACESGGDPTAVSSSGDYRGKYQFSPSTWASVGGSGDPAAAPEAEQDYRAALLYSRAGSSPWPVCG